MSDEKPHNHVDVSTVLNSKLIKHFTAWGGSQGNCIPQDELEEITRQIEALIEREKEKAMQKFGLKKGVKYDIKASDKVIVITWLITAGEQE